MKKHTIFLGILITILLFGQNIIAQEALISVKEVAKTIKNSDVIVVSARKASDYNKVHVKGAINIDNASLQTKTPIDGMLKSDSEIASILGSKGITSDKNIIVYCKTGVSAGRLYWVLKYMGCDNVSLMDGNMEAWRAARKPVTRIPTSVSKTTFTPNTNNNIIATKQYVKSKISNSGTILIDSRKKEDYDVGHIGNAVNIPYSTLLNTSKFKSKEILQSIFNNAGVTSSKEIILYCKTGTTAGMLFFVLKELLNYPNVKVYDGAYNEWSASK